VCARCAERDIVYGSLVCPLFDEAAAAAEEAGHSDGKLEESDNGAQSPSGGRWSASASASDSVCTAVAESGSTDPLETFVNMDHIYRLIHGGSMLNDSGEALENSAEWESGSDDSVPRAEAEASPDHSRSRSRSRSLSRSPSRSPSFSGGESGGSQQSPADDALSPVGSGNSSSDDSWQSPRRRRNSSGNGKSRAFNNNGHSESGAVEEQSGGDVVGGEFALLLRASAEHFDYMDEGPERLTESIYLRETGAAAIENHLQELDDSVHSIAPVAAVELHHSDHSDHLDHSDQGQSAATVQLVSSSEEVASSSDDVETVPGSKLEESVPDAAEEEQKAEEAEAEAEAEAKEAEAKEAEAEIPLEEVSVVSDDDNDNHQKKEHPDKKEAPIQLEPVLLGADEVDVAADGGGGKPMDSEPESGSKSESESSGGAAQISQISAISGDSQGFEEVFLDDSGGGGGGVARSQPDAVETLLQQQSRHDPLSSSSIAASLPNFSEVVVGEGERDLPGSGDLSDSVARPASRESVSSQLSALSKDSSMTRAIQTRAREIAAEFDYVLPFTHSRQLCLKAVRDYLASFYMLPQDFFDRVEIRAPVACFVPCVSFSIHTRTTYSAEVLYQSKTASGVNAWKEEIQGHFESKYDNYVICSHQQAVNVSDTESGSSGEFLPDLFRELLHAPCAFSSNDHHILPATGLKKVRNDPVSAAKAAEQPMTATGALVENILSVTLSEDDAFTLVTRSDDGGSVIKDLDTAKATRRIAATPPSESDNLRPEGRRASKTEQSGGGFESTVQRSSIRPTVTRRKGTRVLLPAYVTSFVYNDESFQVVASGNKGAVVTSGRPQFGAGQVVGSIVKGVRSATSWLTG
jgi:hypothetical protein